ncbi:MAG: carbonic anhydrase [Bdellovibrionales bacterium]
MLRHLVLSGLVLSLISCGSSEKKEEKVVEDIKAKKEVSKDEPMKKSPVIKAVKVEIEKAAMKKENTKHWGYEGAFGPEYWGNLDENFKTCKEGSLQSPINLIWEKPVKGSGINTLYTASTLNVTNTGKGLRFKVEPGSKLQHNTMSYDLKAIDFHTPSEHTLSGKSFPLELHFKHKDESGKMMNLAVFYKLGKENTVLKQLLMNSPKEAQKSSLKPDFVYSPSELVPTVITHYTYEGSMTKPPCTEGVKWAVMNTPLEMSKEQYDMLKTLVKKNNRPIQKLNDRDVKNF